MMTLKAKLATFLRWLLTFLEMPEVLSALDHRAAALVAEFEALDVSGEYRRFQVYGRLLKEFPESKPLIGLAIELALRGLR